jgi:hypothetical protein
VRLTPPTPSCRRCHRCRRWGRRYSRLVVDPASAPSGRKSDSDRDVQACSAGANHPTTGTPCCRRPQILQLSGGLSVKIKEPGPRALHQGRGDYWDCGDRAPGAGGRDGRYRPHIGHLHHPAIGHGDLPQRVLIQL